MGSCGAGVSVARGVGVGGCASAVGVDMGTGVAVGCGVSVGGADVGRSVGGGVDVADEPPHDMATMISNNAIAPIKPVFIGIRTMLHIRLVPILPGEIECRWNDDNSYART